MGELTSLEICAGAGGQALGLEQAGFRHEAVVELDDAACETLRRNRGDAWKVIEDDVANVDGRGFAGVDLFSGGIDNLTTTSPWSFTRIRSFTRIILKFMPNGLTQKWSRSSGSRAVM